jgi:geranylgeranylglycerol-phosphate geranylgeranyltransferase
MSTLLSNFKNFIILSRPANVIIAFITIFIAAGLSGTFEPLQNVILAALSASFITVGANVINDYFDIEIDKVNKPCRLLPSGKISKKLALVFFGISYLVAWILAIFINIEMFLISFISGILLIFYSYKYKRVVLWGNLIVSFVSALAFIYAGLAVNRVNEVFFPAGFAFLFHFGREIIKDIQDIKGDKPQGVVTYPIKYGVRNALILTNVIFIILIVFTLIPYFTGYYGIYFLLIVVLGVHSVLIFVVISSWSNPVPENLGRLSNLMKVDMLVGLLAIYMG